MISVPAYISRWRLLGDSQYAVNEEGGSLSTIPCCSVGVGCDGLEEHTLFGSLGVFSV